MIGFKINEKLNVPVHHHFVGLLPILFVLVTANVRVQGLQADTSDICPTPDRN